MIKIYYDYLCGRAVIWSLLNLSSLSCSALALKTRLELFLVIIGIPAMYLTYVWLTTDLGLQRTGFQSSDLLLPLWVIHRIAGKMSAITDQFVKNNYVILLA